jgi:molybdopterin converting factor small subunit
VADTVSVTIPSILREYCGEFAELSVASGSIADVIDQLSIRYPTLHRSICDEAGRVRRHINFFINHDWVDVQSTAGRDTCVRNGDTLTIWTAVSGG